MLVPPLRKLLPPALPRTLQSPSPAHFFYPGPSLPCGTKLSNLCGLWVLEEGGQRGEESGVLRANPQSSVLESHSSPGAQQRCIAAGSAGSQQHRGCPAPPAPHGLPGAAWRGLAGSGDTQWRSPPMGWLVASGWTAAPAAFPARTRGWGLVCRRGCCERAQVFSEAMKYLAGGGK